MADRTEAINYRLEHAGLTRKIGTNQVRVIRVMLTGSHDAMKRIEEEGRLPEWYADNLAWLRETFGAENVVSAVVHRDESTPHIHAAVVPIVTGERRKARTAASETPCKRHYRPKSAARPRLCADDVMSRVRLKQYQDTYAAAMSKYGLERGIDGSGGAPTSPRRSSTGRPSPSSRICRRTSTRCSVSKSRSGRLSNSSNNRSGRCAPSMNRPPRSRRRRASN